MPEAPLHLDLADAPDDGKAYWAETSDGVRIRFAVWPGDQYVLIYPGRTEYIEKYGRVVSKLRQYNKGCVVLDWRNQGLSDRKAKTGHVEDYQEYQKDINAVLAHPELEGRDTQFHLIAHSMGGLIGLRSIERGMTFRTAVFSAPMWGMGLTPSLRNTLRMAARIAKTTGLGQARVIGSKRDSYIRTADPENNTLMASAGTARWIQSQLSKCPELALGGPSWSWLDASHREIDALKDFAVPDLPTLTLLGTDETVVSSKAINDRISSHQNGRMMVCEGARHEVLMEDGQVEQNAWAAIHQLWASTSGI